MMNQVWRFGPLAIVGPQKRINGLDREKEAHGNQKSRSNGLVFLENFSQSMLDQQFKFELLAIWGLITRSNGSNLSLGTHGINKFDRNKKFLPKRYEISNYAI